MWPAGQQRPPFTYLRIGSVLQEQKESGNSGQ
ncbi:hypothetical protein CsSME_00031555 [Camellia sinensis var. sinensis]